MAEPFHRSVTPISIILPTYNRAEALLTCLDRLEHQSWSNFEVIIVDDGSTDETDSKVQAYTKSSSLRLRYVRQKNSGPARARNVAISLTQAPLCLIMGDDIFATADFVKTHLDFHERVPDVAAAAVGLTRWSEVGQTVTPFMHWLDQSGAQFAYAELLDGVEPSWKHFYTSNLSLKTELLRRNPFNERFTGAAMEDMELGYRLQVTCGLKITFLPTAVAYHLHPMDFQKSCRRAYGVGISARLFHELWPEQKPPDRGPILSLIKKIIYANAWIFPPLARFTEFVTRFWCPNPLARQVIAFHEGLGYRSASPPVQPATEPDVLQRSRVDVPRD